MTKVAYISLTAFLKEKFPALDEAKKASSIALGVAISRLLPIPTAEVGNAEEHWARSVQRAAELLVAEFNENLVVNLDLALETARGFWLVRYFSAFPCVDSALASSGEGEFLLKLTGGLRFLNADTCTYCATNQVGMIQLLNRITIVLKPCDPEGERDAGDHEYR